MYKFRSMVEGCGDALHMKYTAQFMNGKAEKNSDGAFKMSDDPRITPVGRFLRKWSLDELPQLFNVAKGDMSLVGPRPDPTYAADNYAPWHHSRTKLTKPGITGLWQVEGRCLVDCDEQMRMDIRYSRTISFLKDISLIIRTFKAVFFTSRRLLKKETGA